ncbi:conserved hypothetical protein [Methanohalobium evestigatum Z-7303]|uniref:Uncharacterized protein n=1 Tax=Methanohalobium evestigatum (strain ATCC BAA-1072 / DSM 3721 / NBRC 107634 / OCM 161 / Z-7303) TaxID=644295 RepID=D7E8Z4_METEZ|nr:hypothetical protein [Methanohalobium evestigatum]ADI73942.1 conserved hypothetical protein [Methanohalobium evestigatum Z-7303]
MSKYNKRHYERKGSKKEEELEEKLINENIDSFEKVEEEGGEPLTESEYEYEYGHEQEE